jgi:hypothetical protein
MEILPQGFLPVQMRWRDQKSFMPLQNKFDKASFGNGLPLVFQILRVLP